MPRVVHFENYVKDIDRALKFYGDTFGWKSNKWDGPQAYWLVTTGEEGQPGINGGFMQMPDAPAPVANIIDVPSVDEYTQKIVNAGGSVLMPKMAIQGVGYAAHFKDTEGNVFGIMEEDSSAK